MFSTVFGALPAAIQAPIDAVLVTIDRDLLFAVLWAIAALAVGAIVRSALAKREARYEARIHVVKPATWPDRRAA